MKVLFYFTVHTLVISILNTKLVLYYTAFFLNLQIGPMMFDDNVYVVIFSSWSEGLLGRVPSTHSSCYVYYVIKLSVN